MKKKNKSIVWILDLGSQYTQLIARRCRELGVSSEIVSLEAIKNTLHLKKEEDHPLCLILSGGPRSVFEDQEDYSFLFSQENISLPILGICYGLQLMATINGGTVTRGTLGEYGPCTIKNEQQRFGMPSHFLAWMSHFDVVTKIPNQFELMFESSSGLLAGIKHETYPWVGVQFHPEVSHTQGGMDFLSFFLFKVAKLERDWSLAQMEEEIQSIFLEAEKSMEGHEAVLCGFSGGVDSLVAAVLCHKYLKRPQHFHCVFVDHGLLRPQDYSHIKILKEFLPFPIHFVEASELFLSHLKNIEAPEEKRKIIGRLFIEVFEEKIKKLEAELSLKFTYLLQGTLYPDVIESFSPSKKGPSVTIKSHHNVGGLPERMRLKLLEPLRFLFKDEVRSLGQSLGLNPSWLFRHPFPGPGIGIRVMGEVTHSRIRAVQQSDQILFEELQRWKLYDGPWQAFTVYLPVKTVGVKGDARAYEDVMALRIVNSSDGMTAYASRDPILNFDFLDCVATRIVNEVSGITRVVYDLTSKPPGTIEWE